ncbi:MAG: membrane integrity-associated transporter subunit PqiC [Candidatus Competibacteraceae bacterium]|nr:membrane integrity-associated transporter subunit PqiC [Candidatus Competibacteraceae bacterium]MBK7984325.1 membrane integrity-associated transporter subunit PqiC [Candidatus Competibacteraceae bacterium]MBK8896292.1 membrane integrity-associated transporter subunit PqiC [Candidatus Competibacteraceae bacterium]MBK8964898.1 membrane integrity-associated transporter subunit PqiC [Candidatus Competibacteraceae bacterium]MBK9950179.1 membrane integrity-associated transporter subunit PqiC [Cand
MMVARVRSRAKARRRIWVLLGSLVLAGCSLLQDPSSPPQAFLLDVGTYAPPLARRSSDKTLLVTVPKAAPGFDSNRIAYTREPLKLDYYKDNVWSDTPSKMLLPILVRAFERTGAFKAVVSPPASALTDLRVDVEVIRLQQEFSVRPSQVRLTARIKVIGMKNGYVLGTQVFEAVEPAPSEDAYGAARAANAAVQKLLTDMLPFALRYSG